MVGRHAVPHQAERHRELLIHIHHCIFRLREESICGVEARRARADNSDAIGPVRLDGLTVVTPQPWQLPPGMAKLLTQRQPDDLRCALCTDVRRPAGVHRG